MKKIGMMILAVLLMVAMVACATTNPEAEKNTDVPTQAPTQTPTATPEPTPETTPNPVYEEEGIFSAVIKGEPNVFYKGVLTEMNGTTGTLAFKEITLDAEAGLTENSIEIYTVSLTQSATGAYIINGTGDCNIQFICTEEFGTVTVKEFSKEYTKQDSMVTVKEVCQIVDGVIRAKDIYENGELITQYVYDENGLIQE